jgi:hypothetical protein
VQNRRVATGILEAVGAPRSLIACTKENWQASFGKLESCAELLLMNAMMMAMRVTIVIMSTMMTNRMTVTIPMAVTTMERQSLRRGQGRRYISGACDC